MKTLITLAALLATPAFAQTQPSTANNTCNISVIPDMLHGDYTITGGPLELTLAGNKIYPEAKTTGTGAIYPGPLRAYMVRMTPPIPDFRLQETDRLQPDWIWDAAPAGSNAPNLYNSSADIEILVGCTLREMPRFIGTFQTMSQENTPIDHTIRLVMYMSNHLIGSWRFTAQASGGPVQGLRYVIFERTTPHINQ